MREQKEKGGMDNLELMQRIPQEKKDMRKFDPSKSNTIQVRRKSKCQITLKDSS